MVDIIVRYVGRKERPYLWEINKEINIALSDNSILTIPKGFTTDFASVPKVFWSLIPPIGEANISWIIHDYLYDTKDLRGRKFADKEMLYWMHKKGQDKLSSRVMYWSVRIFAKKWWNR